MTVTIRTASMDDLSALDRLFQRSYMRLLAPDYPPSVLMTAVPVIARAQPDLLRSGLFFVAENAGGIAGAGGWSLNAPGGRPGTRGVGHIRHVATDPDQTRQGVGRALLEHILLHAKASGMAQLHCLSTRTAVPFYAAIGFVSQGGVSIPLRGGLEFPSVFMVAQL
jgi:GNAT superfamily N-acetyltransferase